MSDNKTEIKKVIFMPGCFDDFEGNQEELDEMMKEIEKLALSGELLHLSEEISDDIEEIIATKTENTDNTRH